MKDKEPNGEANYYEYFPCFISFWLSAKFLPDEYRLALFDAVFGYGFNCEEPDFSKFENPVERALLLSSFENVRPNIDSSHERYDNPRAGAPKGNKNAVKNRQPATSPKPGAADDLPADDAPAPQPKTKKATPPPQPPGIEPPPMPPKPRTEEPPTQQEVIAYAKENGIETAVAVDFWLFFEKNNWLYKGEAVENWRALLARWKQHDEAPQRPESPGINAFDIVGDW